MVVLLFFSASNTIQTLLKIEMDISSLVYRVVFRLFKDSFVVVSIFLLFSIPNQHHFIQINHFSEYKMCMSQRIHRNSIMLEYIGLINILYFRYFTTHCYFRIQGIIFWIEQSVIMNYSQQNNFIRVTFYKALTHSIKEVRKLDKCSKSNI